VVKDAAHNRSKLRHLGGAAFLLVLVLAGCDRIKSASDRSFTIPQSRLLGSLEQKSGLIAYIGTDGNIYTMNQAGQNIFQVTKDAESADGSLRYYGHVTWARDGSQIAFVRYSGTKQSDVQAHLYVGKSDGTGVKEVFSSDRLLPVFLYWAPDGRVLAYLSAQMDGNSAVLHLADVASGTSAIVDSGQPLFWVWEPSAAGVLVHANGAREMKAGARVARLTFGADVIEEALDAVPGHFQAPAISPDGSRWLVGGESAAGATALMLINRTDNQKRELASFQGRAAFDWSPDGSRVAWVPSVEERFAALGALHGRLVDDESAAPFVSAEKQVVAFWWSPDGRQVAYFDAQLGEAAAADAAAPVQMLTLMVLDVEEGVSRKLFEFTPTPQFLGLLPFFDQHQRTLTLWSPDNRYLVMPVQTQGGPRIAVAQADGDFAPRLLEAGALAVWSWR
jgi:Tol biopolymer transport system component